MFDFHRLTKLCEQGRRFSGASLNAGLFIPTDYELVGAELLPFQIRWYKSKMRPSSWIELARQIQVQVFSRRDQSTPRSITCRTHEFLLNKHPLVNVLVSMQTPDLLFVCGQSPRKGDLESRHPDRYVHG